MSALVVHASPRREARSPLLAAMARHEPVLFALGLLMLAALAPTAFAAVVDARVFLGADIWEKPLKFEFALAVYLLTLVFFARFLPDGATSRRWYRIYVSAVAAAVVLEMVWIGGAAALGTASHFNETPAGMAIYMAMGLAAVLLTTTSAVYAVLIARNGALNLSPALRESVVLGLALVLPLTLLTAGTMSSLNGHWVGVDQGNAEVLPLLDWARNGGDLRVSHFFATHAMHFVPAFGLFSAYLFGGDRKMPVRLFAAAYVLLVAFLFAQALAGRPFLPGLG